MPLYEFECGRCGKKKEDFVKLGTELLPCDCGGAMRKLLSAPNFVLKGNNWARDNYGLGAKGDKKHES